MQQGIRPGYCPRNVTTVAAARATAYRFFLRENRIPAVIRHGVKADSVDAVNHGASDIKAITETSLM